jgi:phosphopantothenoylcysteine synthetase/decarboxylase
MRPVLITAGATRNPVDSMRFISANSSGRTSAALAAQLPGSTLLGSPEAVLRAPGSATTETYSTTRDLMARMQRWVRGNPGAVVVHAAAVGDYEAAEVEAGKIASGEDELVIRLKKTPKIADHVLGWDPSCVLVTFKAAPPETEGEQLIAICRTQLRRTGSALVVGNVIGRLGSTTTLVDADGSEAFDDRASALYALGARLRALREIE